MKVWIVRDDETRAVAYIALNAEEAWSWVESAPGDHARDVTAFEVGMAVREDQ